PPPPPLCPYTTLFRSKAVGPGRYGAAMTAQTPPNWYPDPQNPALVRWWDGQRWTEHVQERDAAAPPPSPARAQVPAPAPAAPAQDRKSTRLNSSHVKI